MPWTGCSWFKGQACEAIVSKQRIRKSIKKKHAQVKIIVIVNSLHNSSRISAFTGQLEIVKYNQEKSIAEMIFWGNNEIGRVLHPLFSTRTETDIHLLI